MGFLDMGFLDMGFLVLRKLQRQIVDFRLKTEFNYFWLKLRIFNLKSAS
jgi:hypothetical protein